MREIVTTGCITLLVVAALWCLTFLFELVRAPALLDRDRKADIDTSAQKIRELENERPYFISKPYPSNLGNQQLKKRTLEIVEAIKDIYLRQSMKETRLRAESFLNRALRNTRTLTSEVESEEGSRQSTKNFWKENEENARIREEHLIVYSKKYESDAILMRDEILERLPEDIATRKRHRFLPDNSVQYHLGPGAFSLSAIAQDLDILAHLIPDELGP